MDFDDGPAEAGFRRAARQWLTEHAERRAGSARSVERLLEFNVPGEGEWVTACRRWQRSKHDGGYAGLTVPRQWGGRGLGPMEEIIFSQEEAHFDVAVGAFGVTLGMIAPTLLAHGTRRQKAHVPRMLSGDELWCQLFSEPAAGSDLSAVGTRADQDGAEWVITGQKVWTSFAHRADWGYILCRTSSGLEKHSGLTSFLVPMGSPGITVRPLRQMTGASNFNEVFLDGVRVPDENRLGAVGAGWRVAITTLMNERYSVSGAPIGAFEALLDHARAHGVDRHPVVRQRMADVCTRLRVHSYTVARALTAISKGTAPGPEGAISKLAYVSVMRQLAELAVAIGGPSGGLAGAWSDLFLGAPGLRLGGGTDEIMRNVISERVLGLPRELRPDAP